MFCPFFCGCHTPLILALLFTAFPALGVWFYKRRHIVLKDDVFDRFVKACRKGKPNKALRDAVKHD
jgi:hypothetical protein